MTLTVAIAAESDGYDGFVYEYLLSQLLGVPVVRWAHGMVFNGNRSVAKAAHAFLNAAANAGVRHALLAIDNDGGSQRRSEHQPTCTTPAFDINEDVGCRECWLEAAAPPAWTASGGQLSVVVPVQTLETWLLTLRGAQLNAPSPEQYYNRNALKAQFFGSPRPNLNGRVAQATAALQQPTAIQLLSLRPSFRRFKDRVAQWTVP